MSGSRAGQCITLSFQALGRRWTTPLDTTRLLTIASNMPGIYRGVNPLALELYLLLSNAQMVPSKVDCIRQVVPDRPGDVGNYSSHSPVYSLIFFQRQDPLAPLQSVKNVFRLFERACQRHLSDF